ncbi:MAG: potassium-transporting ATPase subunit KdpA [Planctomycetota bacterium]|nr:MAG: potassium-transporting ATPase subunit KdpA [Planctomycetota bacterium]
MTTSAAAEVAVILAAVALAAVAISPWLTTVFRMGTDTDGTGLPGTAGWFERWLTAIERPLLRAAGVWPVREMTATEYGAAIVVFHAAGFGLLLFFLRFQPLLPWNPDHLPAVPWLIAINTAASFVTNTNWQSYGGETTLSPLSQSLGLTVQNFASAACGLCVLAVLARGLVRRDSPTIGNFWQDLVRAIVGFLLPLAILLGLVLTSQGVVQSFETAIDVPLVDQDAVVEGAPPATRRIVTGPVASQVAIKQLGTNGGGYFNANSAHPFENPTPLTNLLEIVAMLMIPVASCLAFGRWVGDRRQGHALLAAMALLFLPFLLLIVRFETSPNPRLTAAAPTVDQSALGEHGGGALEGKEVRFGPVASAVFAVSTTATSCGAVNAMHDSFSPLGGLVAMWMMQLGEVVFGGVGTGLAGLIAYTLVAVFVAGLMVGRSPEYLGKKIESREMKMGMIVLLVPPIATLVGTATACVMPAEAAAAPNPGPHGFSELLYAFTSASNNNGSAFGGITATSAFWTLALAAAMLGSRLLTMLPLLAIGGSLAAKRTVAQSPGTLPTHTPLFVLLVAGTVILVGALSFVPALALGPIAEALQPPAVVLTGDGG